MMKAELHFSTKFASQKDLFRHWKSVRLLTIVFRK